MRFSSELAGDHGAAGTVSGSVFDAEGFDFENQLVAWDDSFSDFHFIHTQQDGELAGMFQSLREEEAGHLGHRFDN